MMIKQRLDHYWVTADNSVGDNIKVEVITEPEVTRWNDEKRQMETHDEFVAIRFLTGEKVVFQVQGPVAHNLIVNLVDMLNETKVGELPF